MTRGQWARDVRKTEVAGSLAVNIALPVRGQVSFLGEDITRASARFSIPATQSSASATATKARRAVTIVEPPRSSAALRRALTEG